MRHFRRRTDFGCLALLALAAQILLSFGHFHAPRAASADLPLVCRTFYQPSADQSCPPVRQEDKCCATCWTINLAGSLVLPEPPTLVLPTRADESRLPPHRRVLPPDIRTAAFDARGPPLSVAA